MRLSSFWAPRIASVRNVDAGSATLMEDLSLARKTASGLFTLLPLGTLVFERMKDVVRRHMRAAGAQEVVFSTLMPRSLWQESGRWESFGPALMKGKLGDKEVCFNPTHEEIAVAMVRGELKSFRQLPLNFFCMQKVYRDEPRPKSELLRTAEFVMADSYSFHADLVDASAGFEQMRVTYGDIINEFGLDHSVVEADNGAIGGSKSVEFQFVHPLGESTFCKCDACGKAVDEALFAGDSGTCSRCGANVALRRGIELAHVFLLEERYSAVMGLQFRDSANVQRNPHMGCTGIGLTRNLQAVVLRHFKDGRMHWPKSIRPFDIALIGADDPAAIRSLDALYDQLQSTGRSAVYDDRQLTVPAKRAAAEFLGVGCLIEAVVAGSEISYHVEVDGTRRTAAGPEIGNVLASLALDSVSLAAAAR